MLQPLVKMPWDGIAEQIWEDIGIKYQSDLAMTAQEAGGGDNDDEEQMSLPLAAAKAFP